jgi:hypothetical protein
LIHAISARQRAASAAVAPWTTRAGLALRITADLPVHAFPSPTLSIPWS